MPLPFSCAHQTVAQRAELGLPLRLVICWLALGLTMLGSLACGNSSAGKSKVEADGSPAADAGRDGATGGCLPFKPAADCVTPTDFTLPSELRCTGLYGDWEKRALACGIQEYEPVHPLWSDGSVKRRFVSLPANSKVDVSKPDAFEFPIGTQFWKEFTIQDGQGGSRLAETRLLRKATADDWVYTSYVWNEDGSAATQQNDGVRDLFGLSYDVPTRDQCAECHQGRSDFVLGWDVLMLGPGAKGVTLATLTAENSITGTLPSPILSIPGNAVEQAALGYLHANCGVSCHNRNDDAKGKISGLFLRLDAGTLGSVQSTDAFVSGMNKPPNQNLPTAITNPASGVYVDIRPLDLERSLLLARMKIRADGQMPQIATRVVDQTGVDAVTAWVMGMTEAAGYPKPVSP